MRRSPRLRRVPGGWFAVRGGSAWWRAVLAQAALLWILPWPMMAVGRFAPPTLRHRFEQAWARAASRILGLRLEFSGLERIAPAQSYVVLALHESLVDPLVLWHLPMPLRFIARDELLGWPIVGAYLRATGQLTVADQGGAPAPALRRGATQAVASGESLAVFPQGSVLGIEVGFRSGAVRLARWLGRPILPVVISGTHRVWEHPFSLRLRFGQRVSVTVLEPIEVDRLTRAELERETLRLEAVMKGIALGPGRAAPRRYLPARDGTWDAYDFVIDPAFDAVARALPHRVRRDGAALR